MSKIILAVALVAGCHPRIAGGDHTDWGAPSHQVGTQLDK